MAPATQELIARLLRLNAYDWRLYVMARALLERHAAACEAEGNSRPAPDAT